MQSRSCRQSWGTYRHPQIKRLPAGLSLRESKSDTYTFFLHYSCKYFVHIRCHIMDCNGMSNRANGSGGCAACSAHKKKPRSGPAALASYGVIEVGLGIRHHCRLSSVEYMLDLDDCSCQAELVSVIPRNMNSWLRAQPACVINTLTVLMQQNEQTFIYSCSASALYSGHADCYSQSLSIVVASSQQVS